MDKLIKISPLIVFGCSLANFNRNYSTPKLVCTFTGDLKECKRNKKREMMERGFVAINLVGNFTGREREREYGAV